MSINLTESGESVYTQDPIELRANNSVYRTIDKIVTNTNHGLILDIGSSDGVVNNSFQLTDRESIVGLDLSKDALNKNSLELPVQADARQLPFRDNQFTTILALDIIEHFPFKDARQVLDETKRVGTYDHSLIVSMPIVDPTRIMTWVEAIRAIKARERPSTGLFDRTHQILRGIKFHSKLFDKSGYYIENAYDTIAHTNGSRDIQNKTDLVTAESMGKNRNTVKERLVGQYADRQSDQNATAQIIAYLLAYQRIYVLKQK